ncbi:MAG TPA: LysR substrate-binding domain-containing protein, partial [Pseudolysinimonas sp.]
LRSADAMVIPHGFLVDLPFADLWRDDWLAIVANGNSVVQDAVTMDDLATLPWVLNYQSRSAFTSAERQLQQLGIEPHVDVVVESFLAVPQFVAGTDRIGMIQGALADHAIRSAGVRVVKLPFEPTPLVNALWWHPVHSRDPEHAWMRDLFVEAGATLASQVAAGR